MEGAFQNSYIDEVYDKYDQVMKATHVYVLQLKDNNIQRVILRLEEFLIKMMLPESRPWFLPRRVSKM